MAKHTLAERILADHPALTIRTALKQLADSGESIESVAKRYGVSRYAVRSLKRRLGCHWRWPNSEETKRRKRASAARKVLVTYRGRRMPLADVARESGVSYSTVFMRHKAGVRGDDLGRPVRGHGKRPDRYEVGLSRDDWRIVIDFAEERGIQLAHHRFGLPKGAIGAAIRGEWHRLA